MIDDEKLIQEYLPKWLSFSCDPDDLKLEIIAANVVRIYENLGLDEPHIIFCRGPMEQLLLPTLIDLMLRMGKKKSSKSEFKRVANAPNMVHREWANLWSKALKSIQWRKVIAGRAGSGAVIANRIERLLGERIRPHLVSAVDEALGINRHARLESRFEAELERPYNNLIRAVTYRDGELQLFWANFLKRLPETFLDEFIAVLQANTAGLFFAREGPNTDCWSGGWDWYGLASIDFAAEKLGCHLTAQLDNQLQVWLSVALDASCYLFSEHCCFVYLKPIDLFFDQRHRLHHDSKAAVEFIDGTQFFFWHGVEVEEQIITHPNKIKVRTIEKERNVEVRRILIERYGLQNFLRDSAVRKIQEDDCGALYRKELPGDEPIVVVKVLNSTAEPDGEYKTYVLRVPPGIRTAREAVAWTFQMKEGDYKPIVET